MPGGILVLVAYGENDLYLSGNPQITFFKSTYKRHTNFAIENIDNIHHGVLNYGTRIHTRIDRKGDLLGRIILELTTSECLPYHHNIFTIIEYVEIKIGGNVIDRQYGDWMFIDAQLNHTVEKYMEIDAMIHSDDTTFGSTKKFYAPLSFWFCKNSGLYLPLIALHNSEVELIIKFKDMPSGTPNVMTRLNVMCDYVFLDTDELRRFATIEQEYLIEQLQIITPSNLNVGTNEVPLEHLKHPIKYLVFFGDFKENQWDKINTYYQSTDSLGNLYNETFQDFTIYLNNQQLFTPRYGSFYRLYQQFEHFTGSTQFHKWVGYINSNALARIYCYSFALKASEYVPSGTCNFSRIKDAYLKFTITDLTSYPNNVNEFKGYAVNYNILKIESGLGGIVYV
jgi:hypothetical protein